MKLNQQEKPYSSEVMKKYCKENIDKYDVDPMVCEAFHQGLISEVTAYIHLRVAQMIANEVKLTGRQIAEEVGVSPSVITKYKNNAITESTQIIGITEKIYIQLLIKINRKNILDIWEQNNFNQALADYVNENRYFITYNKSISELESSYELKRNKEITKDVCRKKYEELVSEKIVQFDKVARSDYIMFVEEVVKRKEKIQAKIKWEIDGGENEITINVDSGCFVHELVYKIQKIIAGMNRISKVNVYLQRSGNRKVCKAMEYLAITKENVYLI